jgi:hypothetical protein
MILALILCSLSGKPATRAGCRSDGASDWQATPLRYLSEREACARRRRRDEGESESRVEIQVGERYPGGMELGWREGRWRAARLRSPWVRRRPRRPRAGERAREDKCQSEDEAGTCRTRADLTHDLVGIDKRVLVAELRGRERALAREVGLLDGVHDDVASGDDKAALELSLNRVLDVVEAEGKREPRGQRQGEG